MRQLIPAANFVLFLAFHYFLLLGHVPPANQIAATFGAASLTAMTLAMVLAARFPVVDRLMVGPGRSYRLHRWLAYTGVVTIVAHWILAKPSGVGMVPELASPATLAGKYATILFIALVFVSAIQNIPYRIWKFTHYLMGPIYLAAVFHTFFAPIPLVPGDAAWWTLLVLSILGVGSFIWTGVRHLLPVHTYVVDEVIPIKHGVDLRLRPETKKHETHWKPGQFVSVSIPSLGNAERHPFTICSSARSPMLRLVIGSRGDFTEQLQFRIEPGARIRIHEVAGEFAPEYIPDRRKPQVWVAGGIGITPFLAAIDAMAPDDGPSVDLIYCYRSLEWAFDVERLIEASERLPQLRVHFFGADVGGVFGPALLPNLCHHGWQDGDLYVCGPEPLIDIVCAAWRQHGARGAIHVELFDFRTGWTVSKPGAKPAATGAKPTRSSPNAVKSFT